jgi:hypothetical protein
MHKQELEQLEAYAMNSLDELKENPMEVLYILLVALGNVRSAALATGNLDSTYERCDDQADAFYTAANIVQDILRSDFKGVESRFKERFREWDDAFTDNEEE